MKDLVWKTKSDHMRQFLPEISVVIATYNDAHRLGLAITSVLEQSFRNIELIVVDDGSIDRTSEVLEKFAQRDPRLVLLKNSKSLGRAEARNVGIRQARAPLLAVLDSDDFMMPSRLEYQHEFMRLNPAVGVLGSWAIFNLSGNYLLASGPTKDADIRRNINRGKNAILNSSMMVRKSLILSEGGYQSSPFSPIYNEDYYTMYLLLSKTKFAVLPEPLLIVDVNGLIDSNIIKKKLVEKMRLVRHLSMYNFSVVRLLRSIVGSLFIMLMPTKYFGSLYYWRLCHLPVHNSPQNIYVWKHYIEQKRRKIETGK